MADSRQKLRDELRSDVALMRELGVARWGEIYLGPPPPPRVEDMTPEERAEHEEKAERRKHEILFASTNLRPKFPKRAPAPESVVQRSRPQERDTHGPPKHDAE